ncbi:hypothetical protein Tco_0758460 [Tanacetum coccineum]
MDRLEQQLDIEEFHECDSKKCLTMLKKQLETFLYPKPQLDLFADNSKKGIDARAPHEEVLRIKERVVKERRENERRVIEFEMMKLEMMTKKGECSSPGDDTDVKREKRSKKKYLVHFRILQTLLEDISKEDLTNTCFSSGFQQAFLSLFGEEVEYLIPRLEFYKLVENYGRFGQRYQKMKILEDLLKKIKITEDIS